MASVDFISLSRPRSHSMPVFHPDQHKPALKQVPRRRSTYQALVSIKPSDFFHLHREKFSRPIREKFCTSTTTTRKNANVVAHPEDGNPASSAPAAVSRTSRLGFSIRRRRKGAAEKPIIHQAKIVVQEREEVEEDGLPPYEVSISSSQKTSFRSECDQRASVTVDVPTIIITDTNVDDITMPSEECTTVKQSAAEIIVEEPTMETKPEVTINTPEQISIPEKTADQQSDSITPVSVPLHGSEPCCSNYHPQMNEMGWRNHPNTRTSYSFNNFLHPTHCPRLTGQCCKCGARGRCRHLNASWFAPPGFVNGVIRHGRYPSYTVDGSFSYPREVVGGVGHDDWDGVERYTHCPCGRGCSCECVVKIFSTTASILPGGSGIPMSERLMTRRHVEVHNTNTHNADVGMNGCQHGDCHGNDTCHHYHHHHHHNHDGRRGGWFGRRFSRDGCCDGGCCQEGRCMRGSGHGREECVEIRRNGERLQICQRGGGNSRYGRRRGRDMEVSCVIC
ncbi:hypothetical protein TWF694_004051 [Orbilia ellipsospora]|uniref:Uncharacterized protein n=1 Tax=Orbilia ellipsospora TaxID=2528407 RepID=A0AAV9WWU1_9PEZI